MDRHEMGKTKFVANLRQIVDKKETKEKFVVGQTRVK
jgi:hypothetical protein